MDISLSVEDLTKNNNKKRKVKKKITFLITLIGHVLNKHLLNIHSTKISLAVAKAMETFSLHFPYA